MSGNGEIDREVLTVRLESLEGPPLLLVELPAEGGGLELMIYDETGWSTCRSYRPRCWTGPCSFGDQNRLSGRLSGLGGCVHLAALESWSRSP
ncbi:hypothetical protein ABT150_30390 [Streptomyces mirabilis]|uniref:hypothetical protein n=1 Tax=Streptomyces mirabilis TaxID=68239 RepID=UPI003331CAEE